MSKIIIRKPRRLSEKGKTIIRYTIDAPRDDEVIVRTCKTARNLPYNFGRLTTRRIQAHERGR